MSGCTKCGFGSHLVQTWGRCGHYTDLAGQSRPVEDRWPEVALGPGTQREKVPPHQMFVALPDGLLHQM